MRFQVESTGKNLKIAFESLVLSLLSYASGSKCWVVTGTAQADSENMRLLQRFHRDRRAAEAEVPVH